MSCFCTQTGSIKTIAEAIQVAFDGESVVTSYAAPDAKATALKCYESAIVGYPTWNSSELQAHWNGLDDDLDNIAFSGRKAAYSESSDHVGYADTFQAAMGILEKIVALDGTTVVY